MPEEEAQKLESTDREGRTSRSRRDKLASLTEQNLITHPNAISARGSLSPPHSSSASKPHTQSITKKTAPPTHLPAPAAPRTNRTSTSPRYVRVPSPSHTQPRPEKRQRQYQRSHQHRPTTHQLYAYTHQEPHTTALTAYAVEARSRYVLRTTSPC
ncbi:uncharacterized protein K452DRAFT_313919 [Aplosporella prunicola CBS 121167]|uniref:Uncharacterized protein n=1 Tax=Aplosporella prunicola CBS 121167 TaxID=1176127 RepID=A0A6A6AXM4_9PEZI|nr:uncharacterized protein K452DRAFT_313919 [Aplosporella prunicola CBS 121167]KAF2135527.1 hypothetical protein K452DRAFT_313919 [Aplosporella prunicola CBS 121167]